MKKMQYREIALDFEVTYPLRDFEEYSDYIESSLDSEVKRYEEMAKGLDEDVAEEFWDWHLDEVLQFNKDFRNILRTSLLISIYTFIENRLVSLCVPHKGKTFGKSCKGRLPEIEHAKNYIVNVLEKEFPSDLPEWTYINDVRRVRNCIVHQGGNICKLDEGRQLKVKESINRLDHIKWDDQSGDIIIGENFYGVFIEHLHSFFSQLYQEDLIEMRYGEA